MGLTIEQAVEFFKRKNLNHFIFLQRRNVLRKYISGQLGKINTFWHKRKGEALPADYRSLLHVDFADGGKMSGRTDCNMLTRLDAEQAYNQSMRDYIAEARQRGERWLHLVYEDDIEQSPKVAYEKVCEFLGVEAVEVECLYQRINTAPLSEIIENYDEVREYLRGTRYEAMLEE